MAIRVVLTQGLGQTFEQPAGRLMAASPDHTFATLAGRIDAAFARWDLGHLHEFELPDGARIGPIDEDADDGLLDERRIKLSRLKLGDAFRYTFDLSDMWVHECVVEETGIDPAEVLGQVPDQPVPFFGWGSIPDQYGRASVDEIASG